MVERIHPTAVIERSAQIGRDVSIGPFCVVEAEARIGDRCRLESRVVIKEGTTLGQDNEICEGAVLGGKPQHLKAGEDLGYLSIGSGNTVRENVTIHRGLTSQCTTVLGDENLVMVNAHIAHDCQVGHQVIIANNVMLAGHVTIGDCAYLSGGVGIHQFCRIGAHAMVGGQAHIKQDVPPYVTVDGKSSRIVGLNLVGLRRRGYGREEILQLKAAYRVIYRQGLKWSEVLERLEREFSSGPAAAYYPFLADSDRGCIAERRTPSAATVPVPQLKAFAEDDDNRQVG